jgi:hypothetical protein
MFAIRDQDIPVFIDLDNSAVKITKNNLLSDLYYILRSFMSRELKGLLCYLNA